MRVEDDLRAALSSLERHAPDPATVLRAARGRSRRANGDSWPRWITALAAAASVIAVVAASLVITMRHTHAPARVRRGIRPNGRLHRQRSRRSTSPLPAGRDGRQLRAVIRASATGAVLATILPPRPYGTLHSL